MKNKFLDHYSFAKAYAYKICRDPQLAADIVQQVYLNIYEQDINISHNNYRGYLTISIKNTYVNYYNRKKRIHFVDINEHSAFLVCNANDSTMSDSVKDAIDRIAGPLKIPILLCFIYGYSYEEISHVCDIPLGTVQSRIFCARKILKEQLHR